MNQQLCYNVMVMAIMLLSWKSFLPILIRPKPGPAPEIEKEVYQIGRQIDLLSFTSQSFNIENRIDNLASFAKGRVPDSVIKDIIKDLKQQLNIKYSKVLKREKNGFI